MRKTLTGIGNFYILLSILVTPLLIIYKIDKLDAKIEQPVIIYQVDNAGGVMIGKVTGKAIVDGKYTLDCGVYGKFLVTKEQYETIKVGDPIPEYLKKRGN